MKLSSRRRFIRQTGALAALSVVPPLPAPGLRPRPVDGFASMDLSRFPWTEIGAGLQKRFEDLPRHFVFEYYPWYDNDPWRHWQQWTRTPPADVAATSMPALGPYSSRDLGVIEQHALWIRKSGAGAINLSWWGPDSFEDTLVHRIMDVMKAHDIKVTFHLEPYSRTRSARYADDILYLIREYGDGRGWDNFLVLRDENGREGPVFKSFRTLIRESFIDCHGIEQFNADYTSEQDWRLQTDRVRRELRNQFDHVWMFADHQNTDRLGASGFDGMAIYSNLRDPVKLEEFADKANRADMLFSFNCNPGFDSITRRVVPEDSCYTPPPFAPPVPEPIDWTRAREREHARQLSSARIKGTLASSLLLQTAKRSSNLEQGFFLIYLNSFNEWHEGHAFEPAKDWAALSDSEKAVGYHNARRGNYRYQALKSKLKRLLRPARGAASHDAD